MKTREEKHFQLSTWILIGIAVMTIVMFYAMRSNSRMETDLDKYMPENHPAFIFSDQAEKMFGIEDGVIIAIESTNSIYQESTLAKVRDLTLALQDMSGIKREDVTSLYTAENIIGKENSLEVAAFYKDIPASQAGFAKLRKNVRNNEMVFGRLVSTNEKVTVVIAELEGESFSQELYQKLRDLAKSMEGPERVYVAGRPIVEGTMAYLAPKDMMTMVPIVLGVIIIVLLVVLRSVRAMLATLLVVFISTVWAFGLKAILGVPIYAVSTMIPVMLIAIGVADGIHMFNALALLRKEKASATRSELVTKMLASMWKPVVMTSVTTAVGFISLLTSDVYPIKYFGIFTAFGVMAAMVLSLVLIPAFIIVFGLAKNDTKKAKKENPGAGIEKRYYGIMQRHGSLTIIVVAVLVFASILGITRVWINSSFLDKFERDSEIVQTDAFINKHFGGTSTINVILTSSNENAFKNPEVLKVMDGMEKDVVSRLENVGNAFSITDYLRRFNKVLHADNPKYDVIPSDQNLVAQYLLLYEMSGDPDNLWNVVDDQYKNANMVFQLKKDDSKTQREVLAALEQWEHKLHGEGVTIRYAGSGYKALVFSDLILEGQISSLVLSVLIVIVMLALLFKSILVGLIGSIPIVVTAVLGFGIMGALDIAINTTTALISSIAVGVGIDYAIHFIEKYRLHAQATHNPEKTAFLTISQSGRAIFFNAMVVVAGFLVLLFSVFPPNRELGFLISFNMFTSFLFTLSLMYVLLAKSGKWMTKKTGGLK